MSDSSDANLQLKKRARRRLVGAFAFAGLAAVILPMVMDQEPKQQVQDVQIRIPGQDQAPFAGRLAAHTADATGATVPPPDVAEGPGGETAVVAKAPEAPNKPVDKVTEQAADKAAEKPAEHKVAEKPADKPQQKAATKPGEKPSDKTPQKAAEKPVEKPAEKPSAKPADKTTKSSNDDQRAMAILGGKSEGAASTGGHGQFVILIGAFANPGNVKQLQGKIGELGVKVYTEPLESPEGRKTRVRAGPFPTREAAAKALEKMKRIGVNGVIAAKE